MGNENNKRYVVEQTGFECDSIKLLRPAAKSCIDAWIKEVEEYDTRLRNESSSKNLKALSTTNIYLVLIYSV